MGDLKGQSTPTEEHLLDHIRKSRMAQFRLKVALHKFNSSILLNFYLNKCSLIKANLSYCV
jgi:hypothetical protein